MSNSHQAIPGFKVGHSTDHDEGTGCTVIFCDNGAVTGVDIRGSAPGTRETELLRPTFMIQKVHAICLSGGSAFGLRCADGVMTYLSELKIGFETPGAIVPIVPAAVIYDLVPGRDPQKPTTGMGYHAAQAASEHFESGRIGAGRGATVGKILGIEQAMPGGLAYAETELPGEVVVSALVVANPFGDVVDPATGKIVAGAQLPDGAFADSLEQMKLLLPFEGYARNTTLAVIMTNADFSKEEVNKIAAMAQNGIARATRPAHTMFDGDIAFAMSSGMKRADINVLGEVAAQLVSQAIVAAVGGT